MIISGFLSDAQRDELALVLPLPEDQHVAICAANAILFLDEGMSYEEIASLLYVDESKVQFWFKKYRAGGFEGLFGFKPNEL